MPKIKRNRHHDMLMECITPVTDNRQEIKIEEGAKQIIKALKGLITDGFTPDSLCSSLLDIIELAYYTWDSQGKVYGPLTPYPFIFGNLCFEVEKLVDWYLGGSGDKIIDSANTDKAANKINSLMINELRNFIRFKDKLRPCTTRSDLINIYNQRHGVDDFFHINDILNKDACQAELLKKYLRI